MYYDGKLFSNISGTPTAFTSGNFYSANSKAVLGAMWAHTNGGDKYVKDLYNIDICRFMNYSGVMTPGKIADMVSEFNCEY